MNPVVRLRLYFSMVWVFLDVHCVGPILAVLLYWFVLVQEFKRNQRGTNGGKDYPEEMLLEIYKNIK